MKAIIDFEGIEIRIEFYEEKNIYECHGFPITGWSTTVTSFEGDGFGEYGDTDKNIEKMLDIYGMNGIWSVEDVYSHIEDRISELKQ